MRVIHAKGNDTDENLVFLTNTNEDPLTILERDVYPNAPSGLWRIVSDLDFGPLWHARKGSQQTILDNDLLHHPLIPDLQ